MKPLVFFDFKETESGDSVTIEKEKLQKILDQVYEAGVADGKTVRTMPWVDSNIHPKGDIVYDHLGPCINSTTVSPVPKSAFPKAETVLLSHGEHDK